MKHSQQTQAALPAPPDIEPGDIVQVNPESPNVLFHNALFIVDEVRDWGVVAAAPCPGQPNTIVPCRFPFADIVRVGRAKFAIFDPSHTEKEPSQ